MQLFKIAELSMVFTILFLLHDIRPQGASRHSRSTPCDPNTECTHLGWCLPYRRLPNRHEVGVTCGPGDDVFRLVCCPRIAPQNFPPKSPIHLAECGQSRVDDPEVPLNEKGISAEGAWPWMVAITLREKSGKYTPLCTGFLIDRIHVLTAGHCFDSNLKKVDTESYMLRIGSTDFNMGTKYTITSIAVHEGYKSGQYYKDMAILTLDREVDHATFNPVCLPKESFRRRDLTGLKAIEVGWPRFVQTRKGDQESLLRQMSKVSVMSNQDCSRAYTNSTSYQRTFPEGLTDDILCGKYLKGVEEGFLILSGAPLMIKQRDRWFAIGVLSFGYSQNADMPTGYTRISANLEWIRSNTSG